MKLKKVIVFLLWMVLTCLAILVFTSAYLLFQGIQAEEIADLWPSMLNTLWTSPIALLVLASPYLVSRLVKYLFGSYKKRGSMIFFKRFALSVVLPVFSVFAFSHFSKTYTQSEKYDYTWNHEIENSRDTIMNRFEIDGKQRGVHFFWHSKIIEDHLSQLLKNNIEWITLVPYAGQKDYDSNSVRRRGKDFGTWNRRDSSFMNCANTLKRKGFHIMMKPHIWMFNSTGGKWRSDITHANEKDWKTWSQSYTDFILHYAKMSELLGIEIFCIGTELHQTVKDHPEFLESAYQKSSTNLFWTDYLCCQLEQ